MDMRPLHFEFGARPERFELPTTWFEVGAANPNYLFAIDVVWALVARFAPQCGTMRSSITQNSRKANPGKGTGSRRGPHPDRDGSRRTALTPTGFIDR
jgi:hypothetical protein